MATPEQEDIKGANQPAAPKAGVKSTETSAKPAAKKTVTGKKTPLGEKAATTRTSSTRKPVAKSSTRTASKKTAAKRPAQAKKAAGVKQDLSKVIDSGLEHTTDLNSADSPAHPDRIWPD